MALEHAADGNVQLKFILTRVESANFPLHYKGERAVSQPLILPRDRLCSKLGQTFHHCYFTLHELFIGGRHLRNW